MNIRLIPILVSVLLLSLFALSESASMATPEGRLTAEVLQEGSFNRTEISLQGRDGLRTLSVRNFAQNVHLRTCPRTSTVLLESESQLGGSVITLFDPASFSIVDALFCQQPAFSPDGTFLAYETYNRCGKPLLFTSCLAIYDLTRSPQENYSNTSVWPMEAHLPSEEQKKAFPYDPERRGIILFPPENVQEGEYSLPWKGEELLFPHITSPIRWSPSGRLLAFLYYQASRTKVVWIDMEKGPEHPKIHTCTIRTRLYARMTRLSIIPTRLTAEDLVFLEGEGAIRIFPNHRQYPQVYTLDIPLVPED